MSDVSGQDPSGPYGTPPPLAARKKGSGRRLAIILPICAVIVIGVLVAGGVVAIKLMTGDPGDDIPQPHRVAAKGARPATGEPAWTAPAQHWIALSNAWSLDQDDSLFHTRLSYRDLVSDGKGVVEIRDPYNAAGGSAPATLTALDGSTGKKLWKASLPWAHTAGLVDGNGVVIVPSGAENTFDDKTPVDYVALDAATGARRWSVHADARTLPPAVSVLRAGRPQPGGVLLNGVFYYGDGQSVIGVDAGTGKKRYTFTSKAYSTENEPITVGGRIAVLARKSPDDYPETYDVHLFPPDLKKYTSFRLRGASSAPERLTANGDVLAAWDDDDLWTADVRNGRPLAHVTLSTLAAVDGVLGRTVLVSDRTGADIRVVGYDLLTGRQRWSSEPFPDDFALDVTVGVADGTAVAIGSGLAILDPDTGKRVFRREVSTSSNGGLVAPAAGHLVVSFDRGVAGYR